MTSRFPLSDDDRRAKARDRKRAQRERARRGIATFNVQLDAAAVEDALGTDNQSLIERRLAQFFREKLRLDP